MAVHVPSWFYVFTGTILVISGVAQLILRPRGERVRPGALFSLFSIAAGLLVVYFGLFVHR